ncbi:MAG TPA: SdrD B-like domain-containing protein, partial [Herpetosiphonaceae bacterium]
ASTSGRKVEVLIDGSSRGLYDLYSATTTTRTFAFGELSAGPHILELRPFDGPATLDAFVTPGSPPYATPVPAASIIRHEEDDAAFRFNGNAFQSGTSWSMGSHSAFSRGYGVWSRTANDALSYTFNGSWVSVGFLTKTNAGTAEILVDGVSRGIVDTYSRTDDTTSVAVAGLSAGQHTLVVKILGQRNAFSSDNYVHLDYVDVWDGTTMADGRFEEGDPRVARTTNWSSAPATVASAGSYLHSGSLLWFPFTGDSITYQAFTSTSAGLVEVLIDGVSKGRFDLASDTAGVRSFSFDGLGAGPHVLLVKPVRGVATVDAFITPGTAPFVTPPQRTGIVRYEADDPALRFNSAPYAVTAPSWSAMDYVSHLHGSDGSAVWSRTAGDTASLTFSGSWVSLGLLPQSNAGQAEILIDGVSRGIVDTYSPAETTSTVTYADLGPGQHTITVNVLGQRHVSAADDYILLDYIDVWDGTTLPDGSFEELDGRVIRSRNWTRASNATASGGAYLRSGSNVWFPFTGTSVTYQALAAAGAGKAHLSIDGNYYDYLDLGSTATAARSFSATGLPPGPHMLQVQAEGTIYVDAFVTPANGPQTPRHVSLKTSTVSATSPHRADGSDAATITVTVRDASGHPLAGKPVWVALAAAGVELSQAPVTSGADGTATFTMTSTEAGAFAPTVLIVDGPVTLTVPQPVVQFTAGTITGRVFEDTDRDGTQDAGEPGVGGVPVALNDDQGAPLSSTATGGDGSFTFSSLQAGSYGLVASSLADWAFSTPTQLSITLDEFGTSGGHLFGAYAVAQVDGVVWNDANQNGARDTGETGIAGVTVAANGSAGAVASATTDAQGRYTLAVPAPKPAAPANFTFNAQTSKVTEPATTRVDNAQFAHGGYAVDPFAAADNVSFDRPAFNLDPATYPQNYNFETGDLTGWSASSGITNAAGSMDGSRYAATPNLPNGSLTSSVFQIGMEAQTLTWQWRTRWGTESYVQILDESGQHVLRTVVNNGGTNGSWYKAFADVSAYRGQKVRLRFLSSGYGGSGGNWFHVDNIGLEVSVPGWQMAGNTWGSNGALYGISTSTGVDGAYAFMSSPSLGMTSAAFEVGAEVQTLSWQWRTRWGTESYVQLLDESGQLLRTVVNNGGTNGSWYKAFADVSAYRGQNVRLRFVSSGYGASGGNWFHVDNIGLEVSIPGWQTSGNTWGSNGALYGISTASDGVDGAYAFMSSPNLAMTSAAFEVGSEAQTLSWQWRTRWGTESYVQLLDESGQLLRTVVNNGGTNGSWYKAVTDVGAYRGQKVRLRFVSSGYGGSGGNWFHVDNVGLEVSIPGWQVSGNTWGSNGALYGISSGSDGIDGAYAFMSSPNLGMTSTAFEIGADAQTLSWQWRTRWGTETYMQLLDESGQQVLRTLVNNGGTNGSWHDATNDIRTLRGQKVRLRIFSSSYGGSGGNWFHLDNVRLEPAPRETYTITQTNLAGWTSSTPDTVSVSVRGGSRVAVNFGDYGGSAAAPATGKLAAAPATAAQVEATISRADHSLWSWSGSTAQADRSGAGAALDVLGTTNPVTPTASLTDTTTLVKMSNYLLQQQQADGGWYSEHNGPEYWWANTSGTNRSPALTAYTIVALGKVYDLTGDARYKTAIVKASNAMLPWPYTGRNTDALHAIIGLHAALPYIDDDALATSMEERMLVLSTYLRGQQHADGGWDIYPNTTISDPLPTAGVLYALSRLQPVSTDTALMRATEYLLKNQRADGQWTSRYHSNPIMPTTWVDMSLPWIYEVLSSYSLNVAHVVPQAGVEVLAESVSPAPTTTPGDAATTYGWQYNQTERERVRELSFRSRLVNLRPGEVRQVSNGTTVTYSIESGSNTITLPPLFVQAPHIITIDPTT